MIAPEGATLNKDKFMNQTILRGSVNVARRGFLQTLGVGLGAGLLAPRSLFAVTDKSRGGSKPLIIGQGAHTYEWTNNWAKLPAGMQISNCHGGIVLDSHGRVYLNTDTENAVMVFDPDGKFVKGFGKDYQGGAHGMMIRKEGRDEFIYITHTARHELIKLTLDGEQVWTRGYPEQPGVYKEAAEYKPTAVAFAPNGDIYVTDGYGKFYVHHYNSRGDYVRTWGGKGSEPGQLNNPHGIWVDTRDKKRPLVVVADRANNRLQMFTLDGKHHSFVTEELRLPSNMDQRGGDLVIADLAGKITVLDKNNKIVTHLGDNTDPKKRATNKVPPAEWVDGVFISPHCPRWDKQGNLYVHEWLTAGRVTKLRRV
jgi:hypothetical protein